jgi:hypothetical protein
MVRSVRSVPNTETAFLPVLVIMLGMVTLLTVAGYWLMQPAVFKNPGLAAYKPPTAAAVLDYGWAERSVEVELAAKQVAEAENAKLAVRPALLAGARTTDGLDRLAVTATAPQQKTATARVTKREDAPSAPRVAQSDLVSFVQRWFGSF